MAQGGTFGVGFLGAGKMATALGCGWLRAGLLDPDRSRASDPVPAARDGFQAETGLPAGADNLAVVESCDVLLLAVKPQSMAGLLAEVRPAVSARHLVVSIAAGVPLKRLAEGLGAD